MATATIPISFDNKLLIVGESHYHDNTPDSIKKHKSPMFTREVIEELAINVGTWNKDISNLHKALFRNDEFDSSTFWNLVSFIISFNKPMETNKGRPVYDDFYNSWFQFLEIIKLLKPKTCLFIGTSAANSLAHAIQDTEFTTDE